MRARYYQPTTGRFTQEDPAKDGLNWYTYAANNPIMFIDPSGLSLQIEGDETQRQEVFSILKELAGGHRIYMDEYGYISMINAPKNSTPASRKLIMGLINSPHEIRIGVGTSWSATPDSVHGYIQRHTEHASCN